jgi:excisionase family DNA binding protein
MTLANVTEAHRRAFTTSEVANQIGLTPAQVRHLIRRGKLRARTTGKCYIIPRDSLDEYLGGENELINPR